MDNPVNYTKSISNYCANECCAAKFEKLKKENESLRKLVKELGVEWQVSEDLTSAIGDSNPTSTPNTSASSINSSGWGSFGGDLPSPIFSNSVEVKYLNVAEKNDAAKTIAALLSERTSTRRDGLSLYNKIYEFEHTVRGENAKMVMTSVSGHLLEYEFKNSRCSNPEQLFDAEIVKKCPDKFLNIQKTLEREVSTCNGLIIWTDCDRDGESIGFEIMEVCQAVKPGLPVFRAKFSNMSARSVKRALINLIRLDARQNDAVQVRSEIDLRIGAVFTRIQKLRFKENFPDHNKISYGSCQIPTLGFVVQQYKEVKKFVQKPFWKIKINHKIGSLTVEFNCASNYVFDRPFCESQLQVCQAYPTASVLNINQKQQNMWRPLPMDTVEMIKLGSRKLKLSAKQTMTIAEKLYTQGYISYPRTETNVFSADMQLRPLVENHISHPECGAFASKVLGWGPNPRMGTKSDQAHHPIHPTKFTTGLSGDENRVYELIVRHFLACVSRDATGLETIVTVAVANEEFTATGLVIHELNYLEVYPYDLWQAKEIHSYQVGEMFDPTKLDLYEGATTAPALLTEADLITLMETHGIGTDATYAGHIDTIKKRGYVVETEGGELAPSTLGTRLVRFYESMGLPLAKPNLRASLEADLKLICEGRKDPKEVLAEQIQEYRTIFQTISKKMRRKKRAPTRRFNNKHKNEYKIPLSKKLKRGTAGTSRGRNGQLRLGGRRSNGLQSHIQSSRTTLNTGRRCAICHQPGHNRRTCTRGRFLVIGM